MIYDCLRKQWRLPTLCLYLNARESEAQTLESLVGSLLKQLIQYQLYNDDYSPSDQVIDTFESAAGESSPILDETIEALKAEVMNYAQVMILVDALDEVQEDLKSSLLEILEELPVERVQYLTTSRPIENEYGSGKRIKCSVCDRGPLKIYYRCKKCPGKFEGSWDVCQGE